MRSDYENGDPPCVGVINSLSVNMQESYPPLCFLMCASEMVSISRIEAGVQCNGKFIVELNVSDICFQQVQCDTNPCFSLI